ncbi:hypothetical protein T492DRAFT_1054971 [Pavlovales sp. CCMP2436]|nr:hypothetical protein T492DRAFT_1054971 [Pavlovales sp. CCMP2436]|mmetsp:Transcript_37229/g.92645  ORF Transcript_37229/g.92645 Transcript_37229/m.92645 type:complete len:163 (-) Transcript_37229:1693-2181(-)
MAKAARAAKPAASARAAKQGAAAKPAESARTSAKQDLWPVAFCVLALCAGMHYLRGSGPQAEASHILVKDEALATQIALDIAGGADFAELAKMHSTCPSGKRAGGSLGTFSKGMMVSAFDEVIFTPQNEVGVVYGPVKTKFGFHLIRINKRDPPAELAKPAS